MSTLKMPADGWMILAPFGEYPHEGSGLIQVIDRPAVSAIVNRFRHEMKQPASVGGGVIIDYDHTSYQNRSAVSAGAVAELDARNDGLWMRAVFNSDGERAVLDGKYKFLSPVWWPDDIQKIDAVRGRPLRLDSVGLTNSPNIKAAPITTQGCSYQNRAAIPTGGTANELFAAIVAGHKRQGSTFDRAWSDAWVMNPELVALMNRESSAAAIRNRGSESPINHGEELENLRVKAFIERIRELARNHYNGEWAWAWRHIALKEAVLLKNRQGSAVEAFHDAYTSDAESHNLVREFIDELEKRGKAIGYAKAWSEIKESEGAKYPFLRGAWVWSKLFSAGPLGIPDAPTVRFH